MSWSDKYVNRCLCSLKRLSKFEEDTTNSEIIEQWIFNPLLENFRVVNGEVCQLCGKPHNKYQFKIENILNGNSIWIGSQCVLNMNFSFFNKEGNTDIKGKILNNFIEKYKEEEDLKRFRKDLERFRNFLLSIKFYDYKKIINKLEKGNSISKKEKEVITKYYNNFLGITCLIIDLPEWVKKILK